MAPHRRRAARKASSRKTATRPTLKLGGVYSDAAGNRRQILHLGDCERGFTNDVQYTVTAQARGSHRGAPVGTVAVMRSASFAKWAVREVRVRPKAAAHAATPEADETGKRRGLKAVPKATSRKPKASTKPTGYAVKIDHDTVASTLHHAIDDGSGQIIVACAMEPVGENGWTFVASSSAFKRHCKKCKSAGRAIRERARYAEALNISVAEAQRVIEAQRNAAAESQKKSSATP